MLVGRGEGAVLGDPRGLLVEVRLFYGDDRQEIRRDRRMNQSS